MTEKWWGDGPDRVPDEGPMECDAREHPIPSDRECCSCGLFYDPSYHRQSVADPE